MPLSRYRGPKTARHAALRHMTGYDLENQSCGRDRSSCGRSMIAVAGAGIGEPSWSKPRRNGVSVPTTIWPWICLRELMRSAHCRSMRRWTLNGYMALIRSTSLTRSHVRISLRGIYVLSVNEVAETWKVPSPHCRCVTFAVCSERLSWKGQPPSANGERVNPMAGTIS